MSHTCAGAHQRSVVLVLIKKARPRSLGTARFASSASFLLLVKQLTPPVEKERVKALQRIVAIGIREEKEDVIGEQEVDEDIAQRGERLLRHAASKKSEASGRRLR